MHIHMFKVSNWPILFFEIPKMHPYHEILSCTADNIIWVTSIYGYDFASLNIDYPLPYSWDYKPNKDDVLFKWYQDGYSMLKKLESKVGMLWIANVAKEEKLVEPWIFLHASKIEGKFFNMVDDLNSKENTLKESWPVLSLKM